MQLPIAIRQQIEEQAGALGFGALKRAVASLSDAYREGRAVRLSDEERTAAYLVTRMPATYAAADAVLREVAARAGDVASVLDVGGGTGAASLAAREHFPHASITMIERDAAFAAAAQRWLPDVRLITGDITRMDTLPESDLVVAAYSLGELGAPWALRLWRAARAAMAVIEPGTPRGFAVILRARGDLLAAGAHMVAPCPAGTPCPLADPDWCHFAARVERSSLHRRAKGGELGYEDEKFSYIAVAREPVQLPAARIIRHPQHHAGWIEIENCTPAGLRTERISKRDGGRFRAARRAAWGDADIS